MQNQLMLIRNQNNTLREKVIEENMQRIQIMMEQMPLCQNLSQLSKKNARQGYFSKF